MSGYAGDERRGRGIGLRLLQELVTRSEAEGIWTLRAGIFAENTASLVLHERAGSAKSAAWSGSASSTEYGATWCCSSVGAAGSASTSARCVRGRARDSLRRVLGT